jgi:hypothetical protein
MRSIPTCSLIALVLLASPGACAPSAQRSLQPVTPALSAHASDQGAHAESAPAPGPSEAAAATREKPALSPDAAATSAALQAEQALPIPPRTVVLHVGDSFLMAGFAQTLRPKMKDLAAYYEVRSEQSSYTTNWSFKLAKLVGDYHPDLVVINLGANEVDLVDLAGRAEAIERLVKIVGDRPCVWVSPPLWRKDTGIIDVIRARSAPCRFFDSDAVAGMISRQHDTIHPDAHGGEAWAEAFWRWLLAERAPAPRPGEKLPSGSGRHPVNPWRLKPAPPEEHAPRGAKTAAQAHPR